MRRITLADGRWFDASKAKRWEEDTRWDGHNHVSLATGSQWDHERLYRTPGGIYVLHHWSQWQGSTETYEEVTREAAARWLSVNGHADEADEAGLSDAVGALEIK
jgi:hypothetical protein